ncbi:MAG: thiamine pyrophosphate-requiring protein [Candidatus Tectomicrobia bacterium]|nr:thiamine pyrophosphate-requiring protein [Candidatus Tectomicrobia bacterium]
MAGRAGTSMKSKPRKTAATAESDGMIGRRAARKEETRQSAQVRQEELIKVNDGAEAFVELMNSNGVDYFMIMPGSDTFPVQEAISKYQALGRRTPEPVMFLHEITAMSAAHGHFMISGRPQVVMVHVDVGTQHVGGQLHNAQRGRAGVVLCAGRAPYTFRGELNGGKSFYIHWVQEQYNQAGIVHDYVKYEYEVKCIAQMGDVVHRAFRMATMPPSGPVYLTLPREVLMNNGGPVRLLPAQRYGAASTPAADAEGIKEAAKLLAKAARPVIITSYSGRTPSTVQKLVELAELLAIPVLGTPDTTRLNFPADHDLFVGYNPMPFLQGNPSVGALDYPAPAYEPLRGLRNADVVLVIDSDVPWIPQIAQPAPTAKVIYIDIDPLKDDVPLWSFPADVHLHADSAKAIPQLTAAVRGLLKAKDQSRLEARRRLVKREHDAQRAAAVADAQADEKKSAITATFLSACVNELYSKDTIVVAETVTNAGAQIRQMQIKYPGSYFQTGGSCLGWGMGACMGAKLAAPQKTVISLTGEGNYLNGVPLSALWTSVNYKIPYLTIIYNNHGFGAVSGPIKNYYKNGYSVKTGKFICTEISPTPDFARIAESCGAWGRTVTQPGELRAVLKQALGEVKRGRSAVVDVHLG